MVLLQVDHDEVVGPKQSTPASGFKAGPEIAMPMSAIGRFAVKISAFAAESRILFVQFGVKTWNPGQ
jgi:hypothetical protein